MSGKGGRRIYTQKRFYGKMTLLKAKKIREMYFMRGVKQTEIAKIFGISQSTVCRAISGETWADI